MQLPLRKLLCPFCGGILPAKELRAGKPLTCPQCLRQLQWARRELYISGAIAVLVSALLCYAIGIRDWRMVPGTIVFWFPVYVVSSYVFTLLVGPRFEAFESRDDLTRLFPH